MDNINLAYSDKVEFILQNGNISSMKLNKEPDGWKEDGQKIVRDKKYHGTFIQFTDALKFYGIHKDFINQAYDLEGINTKLYLIKRRLVSSGTDIKWEIEYTGLADFEEKSEEDNFLSIRFNSNNLETIMKSHETDVFELERDDSIDGKLIRKLYLGTNRQVHMEGRTFITAGETKDYKNNLLSKNGNYLSQYIPNDKFFTPRTEIISQGPARHSTVNAEIMDPNESLSWPSHMFFVDNINEEENVDIKIKIEIDATVIMFKPDDEMRGIFRIVEYNGTGYNVIEDIEIGRWDDSQGRKSRRYNFEHTYTGSVNNKTGFIFFMDTYGGTDLFEFGNVEIHNYNIQIDAKSFSSASKHNFMFVDEAMSRIMEIITGEKDKFYSRLFGRKELNSTIGHRINYGRYTRSNKGYFKLVNWNYHNDGEFGFIGLTSGFWLRQFDPESDKYKSMQMSLKDTIDSLVAVFNVGMSVENVNMKQRLRIESLEHFYRDEVVIDLPLQVADLKRSTDKDLFFSGTEMGYEEGGEYENELGLDEPNTTTSTVTPLRATSNKYTQKSRIRADDYGRELIRRKPQILYPEEDTSGDEHNWFLDLKRTIGQNYVEKHWSDRLQEEPTGILDPDSFRSFLFTPLRMLLRHGWIIRAGMEQSINLEKKIKYVSKNANKTLKTFFKGEDEALSEGGDIKAGKLKRSKFLPEKITFKHPVDRKLMDTILGSTTIDRNGEVERVPNVYFKIRFINDKGEKETGYIMEIDPKESGSFKIQKANENLIF